MAAKSTKKKTVVIPPIEEEAVKTVDEVKEEPVEVKEESVEVEEEPVKEEPVEEAKVEEFEAKDEVAPVKEEPPLRGKVFNCEGLNVRSDPSLNAEIISVLRKDTVIVIEEVGNPEFFKTRSGYVMKKYIKVL